jgi:hypothetical protein
MCQFSAKCRDRNQIYLPLDIKKHTHNVWNHSQATECQGARNKHPSEMENKHREPHNGPRSRLAGQAAEPAAPSGLSRWSWDQGSPGLTWQHGERTLKIPRNHRWQGMVCLPTSWSGRVHDLQDPGLEQGSEQSHHQGQQNSPDSVLLRSYPTHFKCKI